MELEKQIIDDIMSSPCIEEIKQYEEKDLIGLHFSLGMYIRNKYLYSKKGNIQTLAKYYKISPEPDEISGRIVESIIKKVRG